MNIPKLLEAYEDILVLSQDEDTVNVTMAINEFNEHMMCVDNWEHDDDCDVILFSKIRGGFCDKCGFIYPF